MDYNIGPAQGDYNIGPAQIQDAGITIEVESILSAENFGIPEVTLSVNIPICPEMCYVGDIRLVPTYGIADLTNLQMCDREIRRDPTLETAILISLFTNRRAEEDDILPGNSKDKYGFWGDTLNTEINDSDGSKLWLLGREKSDNSLLRQAEDYVQESLNWMITDGVASSITVNVSFYDSKTILISLVFQQFNDTDELFFKYYYNWKYQILREL